MSETKQTWSKLIKKQPKRERKITKLGINKLS